MKLKVGEKLVVYCRLVGQAISLAGRAMMNCPCYHSQLSDSERVVALERWEKSERGCIIATTTFGTGVDVPGIVATIHVNLPYGLVDFIQESGRGGRHNKRSEATIIVEDREILSTSQGLS